MGKYTPTDLAAVRGLIKYWNEWGAPEYGKTRTTLRYADNCIDETYCELAVMLNALLAEREAEARLEGARIGYSYQRAVIADLDPQQVINESMGK